MVTDISEKTKYAESGFFARPFLNVDSSVLGLCLPGALYEKMPAITLDSSTRMTKGVAQFIADYPDLFYHRGADMLLPFFLRCPNQDTRYHAAVATGRCLDLCQPTRATEYLNILAGFANSKSPIGSDEAVTAILNISHLPIDALDGVSTEVAVLITTIRQADQAGIFPLAFGKNVSCDSWFFERLSKYGGEAVWQNDQFQSAVEIVLNNPAEPATDWRLRALLADRMGFTRGVDDVEQLYWASKRDPEEEVRHRSSRALAAIVSSEERLTNYWADRIVADCEQLSEDQLRYSSGALPIILAKANIGLANRIAIRLFEISNAGISSYNVKTAVKMLAKTHHLQGLVRFREDITTLLLSKLSDPSEIVREEALDCLSKRVPMSNIQAQRALGILSTYGFSDWESCRKIGVLLRSISKRLVMAG